MPNALTTPAASLAAPWNFTEFGMGLRGLRRWIASMNFRLFSRHSLSARRRASAVRHDASIRSLVVTAPAVMTLASGISKRTRLSPGFHSFRLNGSLCLLSRTPLLKR